MLYSLSGVSPKLPPRQCWLAPTCSIIGNVELCENTSIWFGTVLRGDNEKIFIGKNSNVQDLTIMHTDMGYPLQVGEGCTIGHRALLHGCKIGDNSLVGMGAIIMNGATIGKNCLIAAGTLISEGKSIADNSLVVGAPGRVLRQLTTDEVESLRLSAKGYVEKGQEYLQSFKNIKKSEGG